MDDRLLRHRLLSGLEAAHVIGQLAAAALADDEVLLAVTPTVVFLTGGACGARLSADACD
jgi:hypothetical protein